MKKDLSERMLDYCDREGLLKPGSALIVGLSGGADSVCLFRLLSDICRDHDIALIAAHVHHGIREGEADRDERFSAELAASLGAEFESVRVDAPGYADEQRLTLEEAARILRHRELERIRVEKGAYAIALAHHMGDQAETVLMNIFRGTSPVGLCGMEAKKDHIIRPLLFADKKEILAFLSENNYSFMEDSTNSDTDYSRNMIRNIVIPQIEKEYPGAKAHIASLAGDMVKWRDHIRKSAAMLIDFSGKQNEESESPLKVDSVIISDDSMTISDDAAIIPVGLYLRQPEAIRGELIRRGLDALMPGMKDIGRVHYDMIHSLFMSDISGKSVNLPKNLTAIRNYDNVLLKKSPGSSQTPPEPVSLTVPGLTELVIRGEKIVLSSEIIDIHTYNKKKHDFFQEKDYTKCLDYDRIESGLVLRTPMASDYILLNGGKKKLLSRIYIDEKLPREDRMWQGVIADGSHVVWAFPDRLSFGYYVTEDTKTVLKITRLQTEQMEHGGLR